MPKRLSLALLLTISVLLALATVAVASEISTASPEHWILNLQKSDFGKVPAPKSGALTVNEQGEKLSWTYSGEDEKGAPIKASFDGAYDGKPYPVRGTYPATASYKRNGDGTTAGTWTEERYTSQSVISVSPDRRTLTVKNTSTSLDESGHPITWTEVYDKKD